MMTAIATRPFGIGVRRDIGVNRSAVIFQRKEFAVFNNRETQWNAAQADLGILGVFCLAAFFVEILRRGFVICRTLQDPNLRSIAGFLYGVILFTIAMSFAGPVIQGNSFFWICSGALLALPRVDAGEKKFVREKMGEAMVTAPAITSA
ncbi:MAG: hypothetical protein EOP06_32675 [Proteobacteria bacterium]|nr:MAG: hypothetical protein EOP06_32675 [Pseudomonadota bacterium]